MIPAGNKAKRLSLVRYIRKTILHHHYYHHFYSSLVEHVLLAAKEANQSEEEPEIVTDEDAYRKQAFIQALFHSR